MSDEEVEQEKVEVFEQAPEPAIEEVEPEVEPEVVEKKKKGRKPLSDERKAQLREQLKKGRETSLKNRQSKAKKKGTMKKALTVEQQEVEEQALLEDFEKQLRTMLDPEDVDVRAKKDQEKAIEKWGGPDAILNLEVPINTPAPESSPAV